MIIFFGPMGAGKSVQGQILSARHGWRWLSAGQLLRDTHDPALLRTMSTGVLIDEDTVCGVMLDAIKRSKNIERLVLDGFPRTLKQATWLVESQPEHERAIQLVVVLEVPQSELMRRLRLCGRADDQPDVIEKRMSLYRKEIYPILTYLTDKHIRIVHIDGAGSVGQVHDRIQAELEACSLA